MKDVFYSYSPLHNFKFYSYVKIWRFIFGVLYYDLLTTYSLKSFLKDHVLNYKNHFLT